MNEFLLEQCSSLMNFARGSFIPEGGFGYMDAYGKVDSLKPREAYIQSRMIQVFGLSHLAGLGDNKEMVLHGVQSLLEDFQDRKFGGFFNSIDSRGTPLSDSKLAYDHMFILLAATTARALGVDGADELFMRCDAVVEQYFWDEKFEMMNNSWDLSFRVLDPYRGINANMHAVEALTAAFDITGDNKYRERSYAICKRTVDLYARSNNWLLPEHFDANWNVEREFNLDNPADPFRPYGVTIGHLFEWSRLSLQVGVQVTGESGDHAWILEGAIALYGAGKRFGWEVDGTPGFVYTIDWEAKPVVHSRMHWVAAEAVMSAYTLWQFTHEDGYLEDYNRWWKYISENFIDWEFGSWHHELDRNQKVVKGTWAGKPDLYHALNACLLPLIPAAPSFIGSVLKGESQS